VVTWLPSAETRFQRQPSRARYTRTSSRASPEFTQSD
jgi:hypothetical protein